MFRRAHCAPFINRRHASFFTLPVYLDSLQGCRILEGKSTPFSSLLATSCLDERWRSQCKWSAPGCRACCIVSLRPSVRTRAQPLVDEMTLDPRVCSLFSSAAAKYSACCIVAISFLAISTARPLPTFHTRRLGMELWRFIPYWQRTYWPTMWQTFCLLHCVADISIWIMAQIYWWEHRGIFEQLH